MGSHVSLDRPPNVNPYLEGGRVGDTDGKVRKDSERLVRPNTLEGEVVCDFVDGEEEVVVGSTPNHVGGEEEYGGQWVRIP